MQKQGKNYVAYFGDCVEVLKQFPNDCIDLIITSAPFANLYTYSDDPRDFSNVKDLEQFFEQIIFLILWRITKMIRQITFENPRGLNIFKAINSVVKIIPQVELEIQKRCNRTKTFYISIYEINVKYEKEKITFFVSRKKLSKQAIGGNN